MRSLFLIGPMGAGKTTIGKRLAARSGFNFIDSDHEIEARTGVDIPYIFELEGESGFRSRERGVIADLTRRKGIVLATGGGCILDPENRRDLAANGAVIYLHATVAHQLNRTAKAGNRPLLTQSANRRETLEKLFATRDPLYREIADLVVNTDGRSAKDLVQEILDFLDSY